MPSKSLPRNVFPRTTSFKPQSLINASASPSATRYVSFPTFNAIYCKFGATAIALVNRSPFAREIKLPLAEVGLNGECWVKDLWRQKCEGKHSGFYAVTVPPHATKLVKMRPVDCRKCE